MRKKKELTAPCGLACFNCELYKDNITGKLIQVIAEKYGVPAENVPCKGCRQEDARHYHLPEGCATLECVKAKGVDLCCNCGEFPCALLAPLADQAARYPHNFKVYNLGRIKRIGIERWIEEEAGEIRKRYFSHKFKVGKGQTD